MIERISVAGAPLPQGPYSPAVRAGDFLFVSGQGPLDAETNEFRFGDIQQQTGLSLENIKRILEGCGARVSDVVKCSVFLSDAADFAAMNQVYAQFFGSDKPARTTVEAVLLAADMKIEIDCVAYAPIGR
jgi:2-iminobutanoate/2-iminopropanoate deaminase